MEHMEFDGSYEVDRFYEKYLGNKDKVEIYFNELYDDVDKIVFTALYCLKTDQLSNAEYIGSDDMCSDIGRRWSLNWFIALIYRMIGYDEMRNKSIILYKNDFTPR